VVSTADVARLSREAGLDVETGEFARLNENIESLQRGMVQMAQVVGNIARKLGVL
jgi:hypothetical protein